ncbi:MAG: S41 family peptidase [Bacteroidetes bacterium]|nr:S41 family peptidase [Bacteroidota bacterium]
MEQQPEQQPTTQTAPPLSRRRIKPSSAQPLYFGMVLIVGILIGTYLADSNLLTIKTGAEENPNKLVSLIDFIEENYVDSVDKRQLIDGAIQSILSHLDPHSYYISPEEIAQANEKIQGEYQGIGMEFMIYKDTLRVVKTMKDGPAEKAGLLTGDKVIKVDNKALTEKELANDQVQKLIKGKAGTSVTLSILRGKESKEIKIKRGSIPLKSVTAEFVIAPQVGYVKVESFGQNTFNEFEQAVRKLRAQTCKTLIVDLRGNGGGLLDQSFLMAESFLPKDKLVLFTEGMHVGKKQYITQKDGEFKDMKVVVLVDQNSASASEIFAGALQDWDKSTTVGRRTFGKGLVQHEIELPDRSAFRLTIARYYTPTGRCIQKPYSDSTQYSDDFTSRYLHGELFNSDSIQKVDTLKFITPGGKVVYGSGGITPEVFVPLDTSNVFVINQLIMSGVMRDFCFEYFTNNQKFLKGFTNEKSFIDEFKVTEAMLTTMQSRLKKEWPTMKAKDWNKAKGDIRARIKGTIGRYLFDDNTLEKVMFKNDRELLKAIEVATQEIPAAVPPKKRK